MAALNYQVIITFENEDQDLEVYPRDGAKLSRTRAQALASDLLFTFSDVDRKAVSAAIVETVNVYHPEPSTK